MEPEKVFFERVKACGFRLKEIEPANLAETIQGKKRVCQKPGDAWVATAKWMMMARYCLFAVFAPKNALEII
jgi:hypothetical protein